MVGCARITTTGKHPPVAEVEKVPMIARQNTEHRTYNDGRSGTIQSYNMWTIAKTVGLKMYGTQQKLEKVCWVKCVWYVWATSVRDN